MNKILAIHIEDDYLIAAIEPLSGKFDQITKRGETRFPFYFFVDEINNRVDYGLAYKTEFESNKKGYYGQFLTNITKKEATYSLYGYENDLVSLVTGILDDIRDSYFLRLKKIAESGTITESEPVPIHLSFSDNIDNQIRTTFKNYLQKRNFEIKKDKYSVPELLVKQLINNGKLESNKKKFAVIESIGHHLNISLIEVYDEFDISRTLFKTFAGFGTDPRTQIVAKKIVDDINRQTGLLSRAEDIKNEYLRHHNKAREIIQKIETQNRPYIEAETSFAVAPDSKRQINISVHEIEQLTAMHIRQLSRFYEDHFLEQNQLHAGLIDKMILLGDMLNNELVKKEFSRFGTSKLIYLKNDDLTLILRAYLSESKQQEKKQNTNTSGFDNQENIQTFSLLDEYKEVPFLNIADLQIGQLVKLHNNDPRQGKGEATQEFNYIGNNQFMVVQSTRSLMPGDKATALMPAWVPGLQIDFQIERNAKSLGQFRTRKIVKIYIK